MNQNFEIKTEDNVTIKGFLSLPDLSGKHPVVISCHGFGSGKNNKTNKILNPLLLSSNIGLACFDFRGHYDSDGDLAEITISKASEDLESVFNYLIEHPQVDSDKLALFSTSFGSSAALLFNSRSQEIVAHVLKAPIADYIEVRENQLGKEGIETWKKMGYTLIDSSNEKVKSNYSFFLDAQALDLYDCAKKIKSKCLIFHNEDDDNVSIEQSKKLSALIPSAKLIIGEKGNHNFQEPKQLELILQESVLFYKKLL